MTLVMEKTLLGTRAVVRLVPTFSSLVLVCKHCGEIIRGEPRKKIRYVVANIYRRRRWVRVESYHLGCYEKAGRPCGDLYD